VIGGLSDTPTGYYELQDDAREGKTTPKFDG
jgi:hypothetical protein